jgi:hypothetical protein
MDTLVRSVAQLQKKDGKYSQYERLSQSASIQNYLQLERDVTLLWKARKMN